MKITLDNGSYQLELNASEVTGKDKEQLRELTGTVLCHLLLEMLTRYADDEGQAREMMLEVLEDMLGIIEEFFEQGVFEKFHQLHVEKVHSAKGANAEELYLFMERDYERWVTEANIDVEDLKKRYKAYGQLDLVICRKNIGEVTVILTDGTNRDTLFHYSIEQMEEDDFNLVATRDLMHVHVLENRLSGEKQNVLRRISPKEYVKRCIIAAC